MGTSILSRTERMGASVRRRAGGCVATRLALPLLARFESEARVQFTPRSLQVGSAEPTLTASSLNVRRAAGTRNHAGQ